MCVWKKTQILLDQKNWIRKAWKSSSVFLCAFWSIRQPDFESVHPKSRTNSDINSNCINIHHTEIGSVCVCDIQDENRKTLRYVTFYLENIFFVSLCTTFNVELLNVSTGKMFVWLLYTSQKIAGKARFQCDAMSFQNICAALQSNKKTMHTVYQSALPSLYRYFSASKVYGVVSDGKFVDLVTLTCCCCFNYVAKCFAIVFCVFFFEWRN